MFRPHVKIKEIELGCYFKSAVIQKVVNTQGPTIKQKLILMFLIIHVSVVRYKDSQKLLGMTSL